MSGQDVKRVSDLKRLFDEQLKKVDHSKDFEARQAEAASIMDRLLGTEWRGEAQIPGIEIIQVELTEGEAPSQDPTDFYERVHDAMREEGLDFKHDSPEDNHEEREKRQGSLKDQILCEVSQLLDRLL